MSEKNGKNGKKRLYTILEGVIIAVIGGVIVYMITTGTIPKTLQIWYKCISKPESTASTASTETPTPDSEIYINTLPPNSQSSIKHSESNDNNNFFTITVPDVLDMEQQEAEKLLLDMGFSITTAAYQGEDKQNDIFYIFDQSLSAGTSVPPGTRITLEKLGVKSNTKVAVPNVIGMEQNEAILFLVKSGLYTHVWWTEEHNVNSDHYYIISQSIPATSTVPAGTIIELVLSPNKVDK